MRRPSLVLAILDTMWGDAGKAPHWFPINPANHSGRRLYKLTGVQDWSVWVTNACPQQVSHARQHGRPSVEWLHASFKRMPVGWRCAPLLVCGKVAQATYDAMIERYGVTHRGTVLRIKHPAARTWTAQELVATQRTITKFTLR